MRLFYAIGAAILAIAAAPAAGRADNPPAAAPVAEPAAPGCHCPGAPQAHVARPHRHVRYRRRLWPPPPPAGLIAPVYYQPALPSPWDTAYDRGMTLHFRSPDVSGIYYADPGYPGTPEIVSVQPYRFVSGSTVLQYDGVSGVYVPLSQFDAQRLAPVPVPMR